MFRAPSLRQLIPLLISPAIYHFAGTRKGEFVPAAFGTGRVWKERALLCPLAPGPFILLAIQKILVTPLAAMGDGAHTLCSAEA